MIKLLAAVVLLSLIYGSWIAGMLTLIQRWRRPSNVYDLHSRKARRVLSYRVNPDTGERYDTKVLPMRRRA